MGTTASARSSQLSEQGSLLDGASEEVKIRVSNTSGVKCACGKHCNGLRELKIHQQTCRFITGLSEEIDAMKDERYEARKVHITEFIPNEDPQLKPGIKLPKSDSEWATFEIFFRLELPLDNMNNYDINNGNRTIRNAINAKIIRVITKSTDRAA